MFVDDDEEEPERSIDTPFDYGIPVLKFLEYDYTTMGHTDEYMCAHLKYTTDKLICVIQWEFIADFINRLVVADALEQIREKQRKWHFMSLIQSFNDTWQAQMFPGMTMRLDDTDRLADF